MNRLLAAALCVALFTPARAWACAVCFGAKGDPQTEGLNMAILTLLGTTYTLFGGMIALGFVLWRRSLKIAATDAAETPEVAARSDPSRSSAPREHSVLRPTHELGPAHGSLEPPAAAPSAARAAASFRFTFGSSRCRWSSSIRSYSRTRAFCPRGLFGLTSRTPRMWRSARG